MSVIDNQVLVENIKSNFCYSYQRGSKFKFFSDETFEIENKDRFITSFVYSGTGCDGKLVKNVVVVLKNNRDDFRNFFINSDSKCRQIFQSNLKRMMEQSGYKLTLSESELIDDVLGGQSVFDVSDALIDQSVKRSKCLGLMEMTAQSVVQPLSESRTLSNQSSVSAEELDLAFNIFASMERAGPLYNDLFWDTQQAPHQGPIPTEPFTLHVPDRQNPWVVVGDVASAEQLQQDLAHYVREDFRLKDPTSQLVIVGDFNHLKDPQEIRNVLYMLMRIKIANPNQVFILKDKENPYFREGMEEGFMTEIDSGVKDEGILNSDLVHFYKFLPVALVVHREDGKNVLFCNDTIKPLINPTRIAFSSGQKMCFARVEKEPRDVSFDVHEVNRTMKFDYSSGVRCVNLEGSEIRPYLNPIEIRTIARLHGLEFDYTRSEKHVYIQSRLFGASEKRDTIQYFNSFLAEMVELARLNSKTHPRIAEILQKSQTEEGDLLELCREAPEGMIQVAHSYKFHLMPKKELFFETLDCLFSEISRLSPEARESIAGIKILTWDKHLKIQIQKNMEKEPTPPSIVIYLVSAHPEQVQTTLNEIYALFERHPEVAEGVDITPRFNAKCSSLIYVAQGTGPDKEISPHLQQEVDQLKEQEALEQNPGIKNLLKTQIKTKELTQQTPSMFDGQMVFFVNDLTNDSQNYRLHHPETGEPLKGDSMENGADKFLSKLC